MNTEGAEIKAEEAKKPKHQPKSLSQNGLRTKQK